MYSDEGFGVHVARALSTDPRIPDGVEVIDGGTQGIYLLSLVQETDHLIMVDAALHDPADGLKVFRNAEIKSLLLPAVSAHQTGVHTLMALSKLLDSSPADIYLVAVPVVKLEMGMELSPQTQAYVEPAIAKVLEILGEWGNDDRTASN